MLTQLLSLWVGKDLETCLVYTGESELFLVERDFPDSFINFSQPQNLEPEETLRGHLVWFPGMLTGILLVL